MADLPPRPHYHSSADKSGEAVALRVKAAAESDGPADYANRLQVEILAQLVAIRRHALIVASVVLVWAVLTVIGIIVILAKLPATAPGY
ncbi:hypothetical protein [Amycolatopsis jejuensis]|uniref:hypothetical protein n=1 Tax=Amycolatopsis jejuensis TaxID=330084 RepID=UPI000525C70A|nr:hypothetical protein [Amycolatopsis jejuensis]